MTQSGPNTASPTAPEAIRTQRATVCAVVFEEAPSARGDLHDQFPITRPQGFFATASGSWAMA